MSPRPPTPHAAVGAILSTVPATVPDQRINFWGKCALGLEWEMSPQVHVCEYLPELFGDVRPSYKVFRGGI